MSIFILSREKILRQQKIEEMRNPSQYKNIRSISYIGDECAWIHSMLCLYLNNAVHNNNNDLDNKEDKEDIENNISSHLLDFEKSLEWHYRDGIEKCILSIKELMGDDFIEFQEDEEEDNEEKEKKDEEEKIKVIDIIDIIDINIIRNRSKL